MHHMLFGFSYTYKKVRGRRIHFASGTFSPLYKAEDV